MFVNPFEGLLQLNRVDAPSWLENGIAQRFPVEKPRTALQARNLAEVLKNYKRQVPKHLSHRLYSAVIPSVNGNSGKERMKSGYRNRMLKKGLEYLMHIFQAGPKPGVHNDRPAVNLFQLKLTRTNKFPSGKRPSENLSFEGGPYFFLIKNKNFLLEPPP